MGQVQNIAAQQPGATLRKPRGLSSNRHTGQPWKLAAFVPEPDILADISRKMFVPAGLGRLTWPGQQVYRRLTDSGAILPSGHAS
ncbi:MAG: hypothetical protein H6914_02345 [Novosphingobium sp.]|nr:hypothetical protein [Novosphingobium sp.]